MSKCHEKKKFNIVCSAPITINGTTYYRYDIDLNLYTRFLSRYSGTTLLGKTRKFNYSTVPQSNEGDSKIKIQNLYKSGNVNSDVDTFNGKIQFN